MNRNRSAWALIMTLSVLSLGGCGGGGEDEATAAPTEEAVIITPDNITIVVHDTIESGPVISGALTPERAAVIRAEVGGSVVQVTAEKGETVGAGAVLARIEDASLREAAISARSGVRSADQASQVARRNAERAARLAEAGAISERELEGARVAASSADAQLADAAARLSLMEKQLANTVIRAPFAGIVAERPISAGDVVSPGTALFTVVDPRSMKLEAAVPAAQIGAIRIGAPVQFAVQGYTGRVFTGRVARINPAADPVTRQVSVYIAIPNVGGSLVAGLYAEGRVGSDRRAALVVPFTGVDLTGATATVVRLKAGKVERVNVQVGARDEENERVEIVSGVAAGDTLLVGASQGISNGTSVRVQRPDAPAAR